MANFHLLSHLICPVDFILRYIKFAGENNIPDIFAKCNYQKHIGNKWLSALGV